MNCHFCLKIPSSIPNEEIQKVKIQTKRHCKQKSKCQKSDSTIKKKLCWRKNQFMKKFQIWLKNCALRLQMDERLPQKSTKKSTSIVHALMTQLESFTLQFQKFRCFKANLLNCNKKRRTKKRFCSKLSQTQK